MRAVRDLLSTLLAVAAAALLGLWAPAGWVQDHLVDREGFLAVAAPIGADADVRREVADTGSSALMEQIPAPKFIKRAAGPLVQEQARAVAQQPVFGTVWEQSMGAMHTALLSPDGGRVSADLRPVVDDIASPLEDRFGLDVVPDYLDLTVPIATLPASPWAGRVIAFADARAWLPWAGLGAALLAVVVAGHRRVMTFVLGLAVALSGAALALGARSIASFVPDALDRAPMLGRVVQEFERVFAFDMLRPGLLLAGGGAVLMVLALTLLSIGDQRRRDRIAHARTSGADGAHAAEVPGR